MGIYNIYYFLVTYCTHSLKNIFPHTHIYLYVCRYYMDMKTKEWLVAVRVDGETEIFSFPSASRRRSFLMVLHQKGIEFATAVR